MVDRDTFLNALKSFVASLGGVRPTRQRFYTASGLRESDLFRHFPRWKDALAAAGFTFNDYNAKISPEELLMDWAALARKLGSIPTCKQYKLEGNYSPTVFDRNFGSWSKIPNYFRVFAAELEEWRDVIELLPEIRQRSSAPSEISAEQTTFPPATLTSRRHTKIPGRPTYGDPIDFRGLRHAPVNEGGVVFLFGMVARELGFLVESVQAGFPDCEAKRQIAPSQWQRVRIEFEFESRNFRDHNHDATGCDMIVCWRHNWVDCPDSLEVVELQPLISQLGSSID